MVDNVVLVTRMATNTIFYRQDHGTSGFKWRKTGFDREHWFESQQIIGISVWQNRKLSADSRPAI